MALRRRPRASIVHFEARNGDSRRTCRSTRCTDRRRRAGGRRGALVARARRPRRQHGHARDAGRHDLLPGRERRWRALSRSGTATAGRARARPAASRSRPRWTPCWSSSSSRAASPRGHAWRTTSTSCRRVRPGRSRTRSASRTATWCTGSPRSTGSSARRLPARVQISESPVANVCDPNYTFVAKAPKRYLPSSDVYGSIRAGLVEVAGRYLGERAGGGWGRTPPRGTVLQSPSHGPPRARPRGRDRAPRPGTAQRHHGRGRRDASVTQRSSVMNRRSRGPASLRSGRTRATRGENACTPAPRS